MLTPGSCHSQPSAGVVSRWSRSQVRLKAASAGRDTSTIVATATKRRFVRGRSRKLEQRLSGCSQRARKAQGRGNSAAEPNRKNLARKRP
jgi:hypothetical protein